MVNLSGGVPRGAIQLKAAAKKKSSPRPSSTPSTSIDKAAQAAQTNLNPAAQAGQVQLAPTAQAQNTQLNLTNDNQFRGNQQQLIGQLQAQANGTGPSIAQAQFQQAADRNIAQQQSLAASQRGTAGALAGRQAMINSAGINQDLAGQSAIQRMTEQMNAQNQLGNVINAGRSADIGVAGQNAGLISQNNQFNAGQQNTTNLAQGTLAQGANLANQASSNDINKAQGLLTQGTALANAGATNQRNIAQAQVNQQGNVASKYAGAEIGAANINNTGAFARQALAQVGAIDQGAFNNQNQTNNNPYPNTPQA